MFVEERTDDVEFTYHGYRNTSISYATCNTILFYKKFCIVHIVLLSRLPSKQCSLDLIPTWPERKVADVITPLLNLMCNTSLDIGNCADACKLAIVIPCLTKPALDPGDLKFFQPIFNLSFVSKVVEQTVMARFVEFA